MPEGHTVHRLARDHHRWFAGATPDVSSPQGRFSEGAQALTARRFRRAYAHGKHLFYEFDADTTIQTVHIHLGLFGRFRTFRDPERLPTPNVRLRLKTGDRVLDLSGPTCCEILDEHQVQQVRNRLGPDPLLNEFTAQDCIQSFERRSASIAAILMDQSAIAGIGNIYRSELLFVHRIEPDTPAKRLSHDTVRDLWRTSVDWLTLESKRMPSSPLCHRGLERHPAPGRKRRSRFTKRRCVRSVEETSRHFFFGRELCMPVGHVRRKLSESAAEGLRILWPSNGLSQEMGEGLG